jgi:sulfite exporter TauE/SafE
MQRALFGLGYFAAFAYLVVGIVGGLAGSHWDESSSGDRIFWVVFSIGGALLLLAGLRVIARSPWPGAALVSIGALAGALPIFWTGVALVVALALVALSVVYARRAGQTQTA